MIVTVSRHGPADPERVFHVEHLYEDIAAVVRDHHGTLRLCRDGQPDEWVDADVIVCVTA